MRDLFGPVPDAPDEKGDVTLALVVAGVPTMRAWPLSDGRPGSKVQWVPRSQVRRGEGREETLWTMPRWLARDRGWV